MKTIIELVKEEAAKQNWYSGTPEQRKAYDGLCIIVNSSKPKEVKEVEQVKKSTKTKKKGK